MYLNGGPGRNFPPPSFFKIYQSDIDSRAGSLSELRGFLVEKRGVLLRLPENPILLDHETFTDLLWAVFHLAEELEYRPNVGLIN